jgi:uncharacterized protein YdhG (YjbR/CyaY superfamily)
VSGGADGGDRTRFWPAIEARTGRPVTEWLALIAEHADLRYPEQIALLREEHGFSQAHANAVVMYARGSATSRRFATLDGYLADKDPVGAATVRAIFDGLVARHPGTHVEIAWNQPFLTRGTRRLFSVGVLKGHLLAAPWSVEVLEALRTTLADEHGLTVNRKTFRLPLDWAVDPELLDTIVAAAEAVDGAGAGAGAGADADKV